MTSRGRTFSDPSPDGRSWVHTYYGAEYLDSVRELLTPERTAAEVSFVLEATGLRPPGRVGDFGCGHGRHAIEFARRGFDVVGVDVNERPLALAWEAAGSDLPVTFVHGDYADPPEGPFDLVVCLFGSFGFAPDDENARTLAEWGRRLRPGGRLVLELWNRDAIVSAFRPRRTWRASDELEVDERRSFDPLSGRVHVRYTYSYDDGRRAEHDIDVRLYTAAEIRRLLEPAGVRVDALFGSLDGQPYTTSSRRLVVAATKADREA